MKNNKKQILKIAKKEFISKEYEKVSLRTIAKKANLSTGAIYGYFESKEALFKELINDDLDIVYQVFEQAKTKSLKSQKNVAVILREEGSAKELVDEAINMYKNMFDNKESFAMIFKSKGTRFEKMVEEFTNDEIEVAFSLYKEIKQVDKIEPHIARLLKTLASNSFKGVIPLLFEFDKYEDAIPALELYIKYYMSSLLFLVNYKTKN